ncbi:MAG: STT3 domain-containing protein [Promethearchaeota archaeon]
MVKLSTRIKRFFQESVEKTKASIKISRQNILVTISLMLIFFCAIWIRLSPVFNDNFLIKAFDPWVQYKCTLYIVDNGIWDFLHWVDYQSWYPDGNPLYEMYIGLPLTNAIFYWILTGLGINVTVYQVCFYSPAFMGGLTCVVMYFLGKEVLDKKTGLLAAFFLAFSPGYMQRTVAGFYDNETIGVFATLLAILFFIRSIKKGSIYDGILAGFAAGYLSLSWGGYTYTFLLIPLFTILLILFRKYSNRLLLAYSSMMGMALLVHSFFRRISISEFFSDTSLVVPLLVLILLPLIELIYRMKSDKPGWYRNFWKLIKYLIVPGFVIAGVVIYVFRDHLVNLSSRMQTILNPLFRESVALVASVGEHMPSPWSVFYYNTFIPLIFVIPGIYFAFRRGSETDIILIIFTLTLYYFTGSMIRIILIFAPAAALMGSYGISQILKSFAMLGQKQKIIARRKEKLERKKIERSVGIVIFIFFGFLLTEQVYHASEISATQMPYSEIVSGGQFHDWEEAFTWMRTNLSPGTVVVSWWDYGYWMTVAGNVTTVNDNATRNHTRIGLTGMAMMMNDELESARALKELGADYVLVYFGHLLSGLGGDEGKWPWMVKICNDYSEQYANKSRFPSLHPEKWAVPYKKVFDYSKYINESNGLYDTQWFGSQLVRMMFYEEPLTIGEAKTSLQYWTAREISGDGKDYQPREDTHGKKWLDYFQDPRYFDFKVFRKAFFSSNTTVKIYKVDYTAIESDFEIINATLYNNGFGNVEINNTGLHALNATTIKFKGGTITYNLSSYEGTLEVQPGETKKFWFNTGRTNLRVGDYRAFVVSADVAAIGKIYSFDKESKDYEIKNSSVLSIHIDRNRTKGIIPDTVQVCVQNTGSESVRLKSITVGDISYNESQITPLNQTFVVPLNSSRTFNVALNTSQSNYTVGDYIPINVTMLENVWDSTMVTFNGGNSSIAFTGDFTTLNEAELMRKSEFLKTYSLVNMTTDEFTRTRAYLPVEPGDNAAYTNGSMEFSVKNTGTEIIGINELFINGTAIGTGDWDLLDGSAWMQPGENRKIMVNLDELELEATQEIIVTAMNPDGNITAADRALIKTASPSPKALKILTTNAWTFAYTNETIDVTIKNVGSSTILESDISKIKINNTISIPVSNAEILAGNDLNLDPQDVVVLRCTFNRSLLNLNSTNDVSIALVYSNDTVASQAILNATINPLISIKIEVSPISAITDRIAISVENTGDQTKHLNATIENVKIVVNDNQTRWIVPNEATNDLKFLTLGEIQTLSQGTNDFLSLPDIDLLVDDNVTITVYTLEGGEDTTSVIVGP